MFITKSGRAVKGGGGVYPDIKTSLVKKSSYINALWKEGVFLSFAATYIPFNKNLKSPLKISNKILSDWKKPQLSPSNTYCKQKKNSDCYNWITRSVKRKG